MDIKINTVKQGNTQTAAYQTIRNTDAALENNNSVFEKIANESKKTDFIDDISINLDNKSKSKIPVEKFIAKSLKLKNADFLKNSEMKELFLTINLDSFDIEGNLFKFSNMNIKMFSTEKNHYGIIDGEGNSYSFDKNGKFLKTNNTEKNFRDALIQATISSIHSIKAG